MREFFKEHPYIRIYLIVIFYSGLLFGWGKIFRGNEWYLDHGGLWISVVASIVGVVLSALLLYFRYAPEKQDTDH